MRFEDYRQLDGVALAAAIGDGQLSPASALALAEARAAEVNPALNAIVTDMASQANAQLEALPAGPFAGVPFLIKDITQDFAGVRSTAGSRAFAERIAEQHSHIVLRWLQAGLVIFGKTATPELALKGITESALWGATRNPWNLNHTPGGSSGGAAAAVAAGIVPMAGANDGGGSIRIPAAMCGLLGFRPGRGRVSVGPAEGEVWEGASSDGVVCHSVRDAAAMLEIMAGPEPGEPYAFAAATGAAASWLARPPERLRIAYTTRSPIDTPVAAEYQRAVERTAQQLTDLGHQVEPAEPEIDGHALARAFLTLYFGQTAATVSHALEAGARPSDFELDTRALAMLGRAVSAGDYVRAHRGWNRFARALGMFFQDYDVYLTPSLAQPPSRIGAQSLPIWQQAVLKPLVAMNLGALVLKTGVVDQMAGEQLARVPFTQLANLTGTPSISVPLHHGDDGLPIGVLFNGPVGGEARLLQLAAQLEAAHPWAGRRAPL